MFRKNIYKWHRVSSLIIAIPVLLWAVSGFLHPVMTNIRPKVATQAIAVETPDSSRVRVALNEALLNNHIDSIYSARLVHIDTSWFYQVKTLKNDELQYYSTLTGNHLKKGDWLYAQYLAKIFLEGQSGHDTTAVFVPAAASASHDCCDAAAACVLYNTHGASVAEVNRITAFDGEYKSINRLLPVYKVCFNREDGIRIYVETGRSRFAVAVDNKRAAFTRFFALVHTFGWLEWLGSGRLWVEIMLTLLALATTIMGLYIFCITGTKKAKGNPLLRARRNHRFTAIAASLFTLMFTFSGAWHAFDKLPGEAAEVHTALTAIPVTAIHGSFSTLQQMAGKPLSDIGLVQLDSVLYWQLYPVTANHKHQGGKDLMKDAKVPASTVLYVRVADDRLLEKGDAVYAGYLAQRFSGNAPADIAAATLITAFNGEYNFADKRLPVWKIQYHHTVARVYVETATGVLAKELTDKDVYEGYSFALLHKHHFMDVAGKSWRDGSTMLAAGLQILMVAVGVTFYFKRKKRGSSR